MTTEPKNELPDELYVEKNIHGFYDGFSEVQRVTLTKYIRADLRPAKAVQGDAIDSQQFAVILAHLEKGERAAPWMIKALNGYFKILCDRTEAALTPESEGIAGKVDVLYDKAVAAKAIYVDDNGNKRLDIGKLAQIPEGRAKLLKLARSSRTDDADDREILQVIEERDYAEDMADKLTAKISELTGEDFGEHSSGNCPWTNALESALSTLARPQEIDVEQLKRGIHATVKSADPSIHHGICIAIDHLAASDYLSAPQVSREKELMAVIADFLSAHNDRRDIHHFQERFERVKEKHPAIIAEAQAQKGE